MHQITLQLKSEVNGLGDWSECSNPPSGLNKAVCAVYAGNQYGHLRGTGYFVSPNALITARHMVRYIDPYSKEAEFRTNIGLVFGYDENGRPLDRIRINPQNIFEIKLDEHSEDYFDCVLIKLEEAPECDEYFSLAVGDPKELHDCDLRAVGYPTVDFDRLPLSGIYQYQTTERFYDSRLASDLAAELKNDLMPGHSGSPIYHPDNNVAVGVVIREGREGEQKNFGLLFNNSLLTKLNQLIMSCDPQQNWPGLANADNYVPYAHQFGTPGRAIKIAVPNQSFSLSRVSIGGDTQHKCNVNPGDSYFTIQIQGADDNPGTKSELEISIPQFNSSDTDHIVFMVEVHYTDPGTAPKRKHRRTLIPTRDIGN
ncbi:MAG: hypothetical protein Salg2KO_04960 [Salibacteraceae bacterium]